MAESSHTGDRSSRVEERVKCAVCSRRFLDPRLLSCHHTFCRACLRRRVFKGSVKCPECWTVFNLTADGLEGLPKSPIIIQLLKLVNAQKYIQRRLAIWESQRDRNPQYRTRAIVMVTPSRTDSGGDAIMVTPSMTQRSASVEVNVECYVCSRRFLDPRLLSCHHTFCCACLRLDVINDSITCPECRTVHNLTADGLEGLPRSSRIILLLKVVNAQKCIQRLLAIRERHSRDRNLHYRTPDIAMVTPSMPGYTERRGTVFIARNMIHGGWPYGIAVSPAADRFYVILNDGNKVLIFDDPGKLIKTARGPRSLLGPKRGLKEPTGIAVNKDGDIMVSDTENHRVVILDRDGKYKSTFGKRGDKDGQFDYPWGVAVDDACTIYVGDAGNARVQVFTRGGEYLRTFEEPDNVSGGFSPLYLAIARTTGLVYVTDHDNHRVFVYTPLGQYIKHFGTEGHGEGEMYRPRGICVDDNSRVLVADDGNRRVQVFNDDGTFHCTLGAGAPHTIHGSPCLKV